MRFERSTTAAVGGNPMHFPTLPARIISARNRKKTNFSIIRTWDAITWFKCVLLLVGVTKEFLQLLIKNNLDTKSTCIQRTLAYNKQFVYKEQLGVHRATCIHRTTCVARTTSVNRTNCTHRTFWKTALKRFLKRKQN